MKAKSAFLARKARASPTLVHGSPLTQGWPCQRPSIAASSPSTSRSSGGCRVNCVRWGQTLTEEANHGYVSHALQLHTRNVGAHDRKTRGSTQGRPFVHRVGGWKAAWVLVRLRRARWLESVGGTGQRVDGSCRA